MTYGVVALIGAAATLAAGLVVLRLPGPIAQPVPDRWHKKATPTTGGFSLLAGLLVALAAAAAAGHGSRSLAYVAAGALGAFTIGFLDDKRLIGPRTKFAGQITVAVATASGVHPHWLPAAAAIPLGALVLVAAMNSFNFLDNIDGLSAGTAGIAAGALALMTLFVGGLALRVIGSAAAGACLGFLPLNYRPRRPAALFMGDSGSHLLGLVVGACVLLATPGGAGGIAAAAVAAPLLVLAFPILDTSLVIIVRLAEGRPIWRGGRDHISHRLVYIGFGERTAVAVLFALSAACAGVALSVVVAHDVLVTGAAVGIVVGLLVGLGSRLLLVTEETPIAIELPASTASVRDEDQPLARNRLVTEDLDGAVEPGLQREPDHAHAG